MLKQEENELITRVGPGTAMGNTMRRYWMPALLASELPHPDSDPVRVRLLGEDLIAFRDTNGTVGLIQNNCPHRGASLFFGTQRRGRPAVRVPRLEVRRRRATASTCPTSPPSPTFGPRSGPRRTRPSKRRASSGRISGRPRSSRRCRTWSGCAPPKARCWVSKTYENCNYLQAMEGGLDTSHSSFLHRDLDREGLANPRARSTAPRLEVLNTDYGYMYASIRHLPEDKQNFVRIYHYVMPFYQLRAGGPPKSLGNTDGHMWVPIDDETCWAWNFHFNHEASRCRTSTWQTHASTAWAAAWPRTTSRARSSSRPTPATTTT